MVVARDFNSALVVVTSALLAAPADPLAGLDPPIALPPDAVVTSLGRVDPTAPVGEAVVTTALSETTGWPMRARPWPPPRLTDVSTAFPPTTDPFRLAISKGRGLAAACRADLPRDGGRALSAAR